MGIFNKFKKAVNSTQNFEYLDKLIHSGLNNVELDCDIKFNPGRFNKDSHYKNAGIYIDVSDIIIEGNGHTIDADHLSKIFHITGENIIIKNINLINSNYTALSNSGDITLENINFRHNAHGAINNEGKITLVDCNLIENNAHSRKGGAIYNDGTFFIIDSEFKNNTVELGIGGAIYNTGDLNIQNSLFYNNKCESCGAIYNSGNIELLNCKFENNLSKRRGSTILNKGKMNIKFSSFFDSDSTILNNKELDIENSKFCYNSEVIFNRNKLCIHNCVFEENNFNVIQNRDGIIKISDSNFFRNDIQESVIYSNGGNLEISDSSFIENFSKNSGGAIYNMGNSLIKNSEFKCNKTNEYGGAIFNEKFQEIGLKGSIVSEKENILKIQDTIFENNISKKGESIYNSKGSIKLFNCEFSNHNNDNEIILNRDKFDILNSVFKDNSSKSVILNQEKAELDIFDGKFLNNNLSKSVIHNCGEYVSVSSSLFEHNTSDLKNASNIFNETKLKLKKVAIKDNNITIFNEGIIFLKDPNFLISGPGSIIGEEIQKDNFDFYYLDNLIHNSSSKEISLDHDVSLEYYEHDFYDGGIDLDIDDLVIDGCGKTISGNNLSRIFLISGKNIILKNIIFKDGFLQEDYDNEMIGGGALRINSYSSLTIENCIFTFNNCGKNGGAIVNFGSLYLSDSKFDNNRAKNGGCIFNQSKESIKIDNVVFSDNIVEDSGGAVFNATDNVRILNCKFLNNKAKIKGGALENTNHSSTKEGLIQIENTEFEGNIALLQGGAIFNMCDELKLRKVIFTNNATNGNGGAVCNTGFKINISDSLFENNVANLLENYLTDASDEIKIHFNNKLTNTHITDFKVTSDELMRLMECRGGAINTSGETVRIKNTKFLNNTSKNAGGAIFYHEGGILDIIDSYFSDNQSAYGGSIYDKNSLLNIKNSSLLNNKSSKGGAIYNLKGDLNIVNSLLSNNFAKEKGGSIFYNVGNVYLSNNASNVDIDPSVKINDSTLSNNIAQSNGGAIWIKFSQFVKLTECKCEENSPNDISYE